MAEVVGLVIGGMSMVTLFDTAMSAFDYIETGANLGKNYNRYLVKESVLKLRLSRWAEGVVSVNKARKAQSLPSIGTPDERKLVEDLLGNIADSIEDTEVKAKRYDSKNPAPAVSASHSTSDVMVLDMEKLSLRSRKMASSRQKNTSLAKKIRWALRDEKSFKRLIEELGQDITDLENIFPEVAAEQKQLVTIDAKELVLPSEIEEPEDVHASASHPKQPQQIQGPTEAQKRVADILGKETSDVDPLLQDAVNQIMSLARAGYTFGLVTAQDRAKFETGDVIGHGAELRAKPPGSGDTYKFHKIELKGDARWRVGDRWLAPGEKYKGVFDD